MHTIFWPPGPLPLRYTSVNSCSGGGLGRGGYQFAPLLSGDVVEKGAAAMKTLLLPATMCLESPWLLHAKPAGPRALIHHIAWLDCHVRTASYYKQHQQQTRLTRVAVGINDGAQGLGSARWGLELAEGEDVRSRRTGGRVASQKEPARRARPRTPRLASLLIAALGAIGIWDAGSRGYCAFNARLTTPQCASIDWIE